MGITLAGAKTIGEPFLCTISEYLRTIIYEVPTFVVRKDGPVTPIVVKDDVNFRASVVTDPVQYIRESTFLKRYISDERLEGKLTGSQSAEEGRHEQSLYLVLEIKEQMEPFNASDGQCRRLEHDGIEEIGIVDCGAPYVPYPGDMTDQINAVLTAVKIGYQATWALEEVIDTDCYLTGEDELLPIIRFNISARLSVRSPITEEEVTARGETSRGLAGKLERAVVEGPSVGSVPDPAEYTARLAELLAALQADRSDDDAYLRLWFLRLYDRAVEFGRTCGWQMENDKNDGIQDIKNHRNDIAHPGVDRLDGNLARQFQSYLFEIIRNRV